MQQIREGKIQFSKLGYTFKNWHIDMIMCTCLCSWTGVGIIHFLSSLSSLPHEHLHLCAAELCHLCRPVGCEVMTVSARENATAMYLVGDSWTLGSLGIVTTVPAVASQKTRHSWYLETFRNGEQLNRSLPIWTCVLHSDKAPFIIYVFSISQSFCSILKTERRIFMSKPQA